MRIRNYCEGSDTTYVYDTHAKLSRLLVKTTNGVVTKYVYGRGLIGEETGGAFKTYHFDYRGSTVAITDASGSVTDTFEYDAYGTLTGRTGMTDTPFMYDGRDGVVTDENGLLYMRARYYSPELRRFINADIMAGNISNAITLNRYAYANGNPVSNIDPFGLSAERGWSDAVDMNNDGIIDYYIYEYIYTTGFLCWKKEHIGRVYIYVNVDKEFFENPANHPKDFNEKTDLMVADLTKSENPNMYAYQAQNVKKKYRDEIIRIMQQYDEDFDTAWDRSDESLMLEWEEHHRYRIAKSAQDIDFDNDEEGYTRTDFFKKAMNRLFN